MKKILLLSFFMISLLFVSCSPDISNHTGQKVVTLVVGLDYSKRYNYADNLKFRDGIKEYNVGQLNACLNDSKEFGAALDSIYSSKNIEHEIIFMLSEGDHPDYSNIYYPSADNIKDVIDNLELDKDDLFIFYFAGHGYTSGSKMYLLTGDTSTSNNLCTSVTSSYLLQRLNDLSCRSIIILDSCFSGAVDPGNSPSSETLVFSIQNMFEEKFNSFSEIKCSLLCSSKWNEESFENYYVKTEDGESEEHGQFTGRLLKSIGWIHSSQKITVVNEGTDNEVKANGYCSGYKGSLSLDDIYLKILDGWTYPNMEQHPVLYYTNESINLIPAN